MNMEFKRKLPIPKETKEMYPLTPELAAIKAEELKIMFLQPKSRITSHKVIVLPKLLW